MGSGWLSCEASGGPDLEPIWTGGCHPTGHLGPTSVALSPSLPASRICFSSMVVVLLELYGFTPRCLEDVVFFSFTCNAIMYYRMTCQIISCTIFIICI